MNWQAYNKAISVIIVGVIVSVAAHFGLNLAPDVQAALSTLIIAGVVWAVPNKK